MSLSMSQRTEAIVVASFALLSALALAFVVLRTFRLVMGLFLKRDNITSLAPDILFFRTRLGHYAACLILSNIFLAVARLINFSWVSRSGLSGGSMCTAQAVLMQIGIWSVSWFTASHGVHALFTLVFHIPQARWLTTANITVGWGSAFIIGLAPLRQSDMYGPVGASCTITLSHPIERFALQLFPIILGAIVSTTVYAIVFVVLRGKLSVNRIQKLRRPNSTTKHRGDDRFEEYHQFAIMIVRTMFWFPLAFVILLLPFCIAHLLLASGYSVPSAVCIFADVCVSILGFVNVGLLCNTFRVIKHVYHGSRGVKVVVETVKTFGNDASGELPILPPKTYNHKRSSSNHSWSSVGSNSELLVEKASYESIQTKVSSPPPAELSRQLGGNSSVTLPLRITRKQDIKFQSEITVDPPLRSATLDPCPPRAPFVTEGTRHKPSTRDEECSFQPMADTVASGTSAKGPTFKSKAPPALNLSRSLADIELPPLSRQASNKSATLAVRLGIPAASAPFPSPTPAVYSSQKLDKVKARAPVTPIPQLADESKSRPSSSSTISAATLSADSDSDYSVKIMHACKVLPLLQVPEPSDGEEDTAASHASASQYLDARSHRMTTATVWSQESGDTLSQSLHAEGQEAGRQPVVDMLVPGVMLGDQADVGGVPVMNRQTTPRAALKPLLLPSRVASKVSTGLSGMLSPKSPHIRFSPVTPVRNDNIV